MKPGTLHASWLMSRRLDDSDDETGLLLTPAAGPALAGADVLVVVVAPAVLAGGPPADVVELALPMLKPSRHTRNHKTFNVFTYLL